MTNSKVEDFFQSLRSATSDSHQRLEQTKLSIRLMSSDITMDDYARYLGAMREVIVFTEAVIFPQVSAVIGDLPLRRKFSGITQDIKELEMHDLKPLNTKVFFPEVALSLPVALGFLYVVEGSTLGGRVIYKHLQKQSVLPTENAARFFRGYGEDTSSLWKSFMQTFGDYTIATDSQTDVIKGAGIGFDSIYNHFTTIV